MSLSERLNKILYRQVVKKLGPAEIALAREWSMEMIQREHPELTEAQRERFYENLLYIRVNAVDEWTMRNS